MVGLSCKPCEKPKTALPSGRVEVLDHARLLAQLTPVERRTAGGDRDRSIVRRAGTTAWRTRRRVRWH